MCQGGLSVGIATIFDCDNYGAELQAYALARVLGAMGHEARLIDYPFYKSPRFRRTAFAAPVVPPRAVLLYEDLLLQIQESEPDGPPVPAFQEEYFGHLVSEVRRHPERAWEFCVEARKRNLTPAHFRRLFKAVSGLPPQQFLIQCRLQQAASLLVGTGETVGVIAERVGIGNEFYFSRLFKAKYRIPPLEYRREFAGRY